MKRAPSQLSRVIGKSYSFLCKSAADHFVLLARSAIQRHGRFTVALAGGSTPLGVYQELSRSRRMAQVDWTKVFLFWGDERWVSASDARHNARSALKQGLSRLPIPKSQIYPINTNTKSPLISALQYERTLKRYFKGAGAEARFDLVLLGLGSDGHIASLFPGSDVLRERKRWVRAVVDRPGEQPPRITLTLPVIKQAAAVWVLVSGKEKYPILMKVCTEKSRCRLPAGRLFSGIQKVLLFADRDAAGRFKSKKSFRAVPSSK